ncbi:hypothetical protein, partial [Burkholderia sp. Ac-20353]|uniref:hypothetical protein n=1 Tax=Burkholderia sp. Ac-20353 TaxID=2703894 RepID=UPI00197CAE4B
MDNFLRRSTIDLPSCRNCIRRVSSNTGTSDALDAPAVAKFITASPSSLDVRTCVFDDTQNPPLQIFFAWDPYGNTRMTYVAMHARVIIDVASAVHAC